MVKAIFLDYTGTVIEEGGQDGQIFLKRCVQNSEIKSPEKMLSYWWGLIKEFEAKSYKETFLTEDEIVEESLAVCSREIRLRENFEELHALCRRFWMYAPAFPDAVEFFQRCSLPIYMITNNGIQYVEEGMRDKGLKPAGIICGDMVRAYKPHRELFDKALELSGCKTEEVVHIGDSMVSDVQGAVAAGIRPLLLDRKKDKQYEGVTVIHSLLEVMSLIAPT